MRYAMAVALLLVATVGCARTPQALTSSSPAAPTASAPTGASLLFGNIGGISGLRDADFPARSVLFSFFTAADAKYQSMGRSTSPSYIDREGVAVWMQEYIRYRVNGCDHATAVQRVQTQIGGGAAGGVCGFPSDGVIAFPSRADSLAALRDFDAAYQRMGRGVTQMYIDLEGAAIWIQEFLRYMLNACDAATAQQKVFAQIDGGPVQPTCFVECKYSLRPGRADIGSGTFSGSFEVIPDVVPTDTRSCGWTAQSDSSWLTVDSATASNSGYQTVRYSVSRNDGTDRQGRIYVRYNTTSGTQTLTYFVNQPGTPFVLNVSMTDGYRGTSTDNDCYIRSSSTPCTFTAGTNLPGGGYSFAWSAQWFYGTQKSRTVTSGSNTFTVTEQCGGTGASSGGTPTDLSVQLTVTDDRGNAVSFSRTYTLRLFTCS